MVLHKEVDVPLGPIKYKGAVDLEGLFALIREWFINNHFNWFEKKIKHKKQKVGYKREMEWGGIKKRTEYVKYDIDIFFLIRNIQQVEVIRKGEKKQSTHCEMLIEINGKVILDYTGRFGGSKFLQFLQDIYHRYFIKRDILWIWADSYYYDLVGLQKKIKNYLEFESKTGR